MQFIHLSDPHVDVESKLCGIDTAARFSECIGHVSRCFPEAAFIAVTGDLANRGDEASYRFIRDILSKAPCPSFLVAGNHDEPAAMEKVFCSRPDISLDNAQASDGGHLVKKLRTAEFDAIFLNTRIEDEDAGEVGASDLELIEQELQARSLRPKIVFMHHPPFLSGIACMDAAGLRNASTLSGMLHAAKNPPVGIFCGHLHRTMAGIWEQIPVWCLRSTAHQVDILSKSKRQILGCLEEPEYGLVNFNSSCRSAPCILMQTVRFRENGPTFAL